MNRLNEQLAIEGMTCGSCAAHVRSALERIDGVTACNVTLGSAEVEYDPSKADRNTIIEVISSEGYRVVE